MPSLRYSCGKFARDTKKTRLTVDSLVEYYKGIFIMTTNRAEAIDCAFQSRIHLALHYPGLSVEARQPSGSS